MGSDEEKISTATTEIEIRPQPYTSVTPIATELLFDLDRENVFYVPSDPVTTLVFPGIDPTLVQGQLK